MNPITTSCHKNENQLWSLAIKNDFDKIHEFLYTQGISKKDMDKSLFAYAQQALSEQRLDAAKSIAFFLFNSLKDEPDRFILLSLTGDIFFQEGDYAKAREYYGQLPMTFENIKKILSTYIPLKEIDGILALRNNILNRLTDSNHINELHNLINTAIEEIVNKSNLKDLAREQYQKNIKHLKKIDPEICKHLPDTVTFSDEQNQNNLPLKCFKVSDKIYAQNNNIWERITFRPTQEKLTRKSLREDTDIAIRCNSISLLLELKDILTTKNPKFLKFQCCLVINLDILNLFMTIEDLSPLADCDFIIRIIDGKNLESHLEEVICLNKINLPTIFVNLIKEDASYFEEILYPLFKKFSQKIELKVADYKKQLTELYPCNFPESILSKIKNKELRILFQSSRYTSFMQSAARDMSDGFKRMGCDVFVELEKKNSSVGIRSDICMKNLIDFRPDIIFNINHLRFEYPWIPKSIPYITWVQDEIHPMFSQKGAESIGELDLVYTCHPDWKKMLYSHGYNKDKIGELLLSVNDNVFHPRHLTKKDIDEFSCDVSYVANCSNTPAQALQNIIKANPHNLHEIIKKVYHSIIEIFSNGNCLYSFDDYMQLIEEHSKKIRPILTDETKNRLTSIFWHNIGAMIFRQQPLEWLSEAGYDVAIYGNGWNHHPTLAKHARGWVNNGVDLCKVFNASRINLSVHQYGNNTSRVFDGFASGGFFLMRYHPEDFKNYGLCGVLEFDYEKVAFHLKDDLLRKVNKYLSEPELTEPFISPIRKQILKNHTYQEEINKILNDVSDTLSKFRMGDK